MSYSAQDRPPSSFASLVLLGMMPLYFLLNWQALYASWGRVQETLFLFTYVIPVVLCLLLLSAQYFLRPFRGWAMSMFILFLFGAAVLNHLRTIEIDRLNKARPKPPRSASHLRFEPPRLPIEKG